MYPKIGNSGLDLPEMALLTAFAAAEEAIKQQSATTNGRPRVSLDVGAVVGGWRALERCIKCILLHYIIFLTCKIICIYNN
jgi:hypothetical protein